MRAALALIDDLDGRIGACERELRGRRRPPLRRAAADRPRIAWVLGYTIPSEIGDIETVRLAGQAVRLHRLCPRVY